jgi:hypothetical protein
MAAIGSAILADFTFADKGEEARVPRMQGLMEGGMGIAQAPNQTSSGLSLTRSGKTPGLRSHPNARKEHDP